eukprot:6325521-Prymnesium_polylepis.1
MLDEMLETKLKGEGLTKEELDKTGATVSKVFDDMLAEKAYAEGWGDAKEKKYLGDIRTSLLSGPWKK